MLAVVNVNIAELLVVIKETENDDLTGVLEELIDTYPHQIGDVAVGLCQHLVLHSSYCIFYTTCLVFSVTSPADLGNTAQQ